MPQVTAVLDNSREKDVPTYLLEFEVLCNFFRIGGHRCCFEQVQISLKVLFESGVELRLDRFGVVESAKG